MHSLMEKLAKKIANLDTKMDLRKADTWKQASFPQLLTPQKDLSA
jgi:hypothetical protein